MARPTRAFKLKVSQSGFDLIVDCHVRLVRCTRTLLPYGTTLHAALHHLDVLELPRLVAAISRFPGAEFAGGNALFVGAPRSMMDVVGGISSRLMTVMRPGALPDRGELYLLALQQLLDAESSDVVAAFERTIGRDVPPEGAAPSC